MQAKSGIEEVTQLMLSSEHGRDAITQAIKEKEVEIGPIDVVDGEVDGLDTAQWEFGHTFNPLVSIFSRQKSGIVARVDDAAGELRFRNENDDVNAISVNAVEAICIRLSEEPWTERSLLVCVRDKDGSEKEVPLLSFEDKREVGLAVEAEHDLAKLMISCEWLTKAGGHLAARLGRVKGMRVPLRLPSELREDGNIWVQMRNRMWLEEAINSGPPPPPAPEKEESMAEFARKILSW